MRRDLLFELGTEEIPAGVAGPAVLRLADDIVQRLREARLEPGDVRTAATPRRFAVHVSGLLDRQPDREVTFIGPKAAVGLDADGKPTKAALGFLRGRGASPEDLEVVETPKGPVCAVTVKESGRVASEIAAEILVEATTKIRFPKSMRWPGSTVAFSRPVRSIVAILGEEVVPLEIAGCEAGRASYGHPFLAAAPVELADSSFDGYLTRLRDEGEVLADVDARRETIRALVAKHAAEAGGTDAVDTELLDEVTFLVERPEALVGSFDEEFLEVPAEVLVTAMKVHQRYFPVRDSDGALRARFVVVHNRGDRATDAIRDGNERVLRARLADARFFWVQDRKATLWSRRDELDDVLFHRELGSLREKADRVAAIVEDLGSFVEERAVAAAHRGALLCKSDLATEMVGEFPELQGVMGGHYARADGEPDAAAEAIAAQYFPRFKGEPVPTAPAAQLLAAAEKLDNLTAFFSIGKEPKGGGDPFGLRRQAVGLLRLLREGRLAIPLGEAVRRAAGHAPGKKVEDVADRVLAFVVERLRQMLLEEGRRHDLVDAATAAGIDDLGDLDRRLEALEVLAEDPGWTDLVTVAERTHNIAKKVEGDLGDPVEDGLVEPEEISLHAALAEHGAVVRATVDGGDYAGAARRYRDAFAEPVHAFFEKVFVNVDDEAVRINRLALCRAVNRLLADRFADLSKVVVTGAERGA